MNIMSPLTILYLIDIALNVKKNSATSDIIINEITIKKAS